MSRNLVDSKGVSLTLYWGGDRKMYQLTVGAGFVQMNRQDMEDLLIELLTEITNE